MKGAFAMTIEEFLKELYEEKMNALHWVSADWRMETPKRGSENKYAELSGQLECIRTLAEENGVEL